MGREGDKSVCACRQSPSAASPYRHASLSRFRNTSLLNCSPAPLRAGAKETSKFLLQLTSILHMCDAHAGAQRPGGEVWHETRPSSQPKAASTLDTRALSRLCGWGLGQVPQTKHCPVNLQALKIIAPRRAGADAAALRESFRGRKLTTASTVPIVSSGCPVAL